MSAPALRAASSADWDLTSWFDAPHSDAYREFVAALAADVRALQADLASAASLAQDSLDAWAERIARLQEVNARSAHLAAYLGCQTAAHADDDALAAEAAAAASERAELEKVHVALRAALGAADDAAYAALRAHPKLAQVGWWLDRGRERARRAMEPELEMLAAELGRDGLHAWGRLYDRLSGKLEFELAPPGSEPRRVGVSQTRGLLEHPDAEVRQAALDGANRAWAGQADVLAACLNAIAGSRLTVYRRRGSDDFLEPALFDAALGRATLDAMWDAVRRRQDLPRRYLKAKARLLGRPQLGFADLMAPLPESAADAGELSWDDARERVERAFARFYPDLERFARRAFDGRWIDWSPRSGKRPGGFCSTSAIARESRVFMTYGGTLGDVSTLAHELGHAWHGWLLRDLPLYARRYPMTLAETASTFAQTLLCDAVLDDPAATPAQRATMLDARLQDASAFLLNIPMRFDFECALYRERGAGELAPARLCELMLEAQRANYGDALDPERLDPWFWASKLHFYITALSFYNFPYTFGYLFSLGIIERARAEGPAFLPRYEALLLETGRASCEQVAQRGLGVDLTQPAFWNASIDGIAADLERFEALAGASDGSTA